MTKFGRALAALLFAALPGLPAAADVPAPSGTVLVTVAGKIGEVNRGPVDAFLDGFFVYHELEFERAAAFDRRALLALPQHKMRTGYKDWPAKYEFEGPLLRDVLAAAEADGEKLLVMALDGYAAEIDLAEIRQYDVMLALTRDGEPLAIGGRGPAWIVFPDDAAAPFAKRDEAQWVWGAFYIDVQ